MSKYGMTLKSGWPLEAFEPINEIEFKTADRKIVVFSKIVEGEWIFDEFDEPHCSVCNDYPLQHGDESYAFSRFCPNCGALMSKRW